MTHRFAEIMFTDSVKTVQGHYRTRAQNERFTQHGGPNDVLGKQETDFIHARDSFYMATVNEAGWPYLQARGGATGFIQVINGKTLGYADFRGNTQYISMGNLMKNDRVALFFMDYPSRSRLKLLGHARFEDVSNNPELAAKLEIQNYRARIERIVLITVEAFDWNCSQHITQRFSQDELSPVIESMRTRIHELEKQLDLATGS